MITERAGFGEHRGIAEVPDLVLAIKGALVVAVVPSAITAVAAALEMPARRQGTEGDLAGFTILKVQLDISAEQGLNRPGRVPAKFLLGPVEQPSGIGRLTAGLDAFAAQVAVFAGGALDEAPVQRIVRELRDRPAKQERREAGAAFGIGGVGTEGTAGAPGAIAMRPPGILGQLEGMVAEAQFAAHGRGIVVETNPKPPQTFEDLDGERSDSDLIDFWTQRARRAEVVLAAA